MKSAEYLLEDMMLEREFLPNLSNWEKNRVLLLMKAYARQCAEQALKDAAKNAKFEIRYNAFNGAQHIEINTKSILQTEIKTP